MLTWRLKIKKKLNGGSCLKKEGVKRLLFFRYFLQISNFYFYFFHIKDKKQDKSNTWLVPRIINFIWFSLKLAKIFASHSPDSFLFSALTMYSLYSEINIMIVSMQ